LLSELFAFRNQNQSRLSLENISMQMTSQVIIFREHILEGKLSLKTGLNCFLHHLLATEQALALSINGQDESSNIAFENDDSMEMKFPYKKCSQQRIHSLVLI